MYDVLRRLLFALPPELAHHIALQGLAQAQRLGFLATQSPQSAATNDASVTLAGLNFANRCGLAAGLDKNGDYIDSLARLGFGFIEVGTVTPRPQPGNPKPRLFRLPKAKALINRMGFNNRGVDYLVERLKQRNTTGIVGANIGKNKTTPLADAVQDYLICLRKLYAHVDYIAVNISSPNTPGLRDLQQGQALTYLLSALKHTQSDLAEQQGRYVPLWLKIAPDLDQAALFSLLDTLMHCGMDGLIATNTTQARTGLSVYRYAQESGGLSGAPLLQMSTDIVRLCRHHLGEAFPVMGVGGIMSLQDAQDKITAGADLVQCYTGFIYQGPALIAALASL